MRNLLLLFFFISHAGFAQKSIVGLWHKGNQATKSSSEKALVIYQEAFNEAVRQNDWLWQATICVDQSGALFDKGDYQKAIDRNLNGLKILKEKGIKNDSTQFKLHSALGACYKSIYNINESFRHFELANQVFHKQPNLEVLIPLYVTFHYVNQGSSWFTLGDIDRATLYYEKALASIGKTSYQSDYALILVKLGYIYRYRKNYPKAIDTFKSAVKSYKINGKTITDTYLAEIYYSLAESYLEEGNYPEAIIYAQKVKKIAALNLPELKAERLILRADLLASGILLKQGYKEKSKHLYETILKKNHSSDFYQLNLNYIALRGLGEIELSDKNYSESLKYIQKALSEVSDQQLKGEFKNPSAIKPISNALGVSSVVNKKVEVLLLIYEKTKELKYLKAAFETQKLVVDIAKKLRQSHETLESRVLFSDYFYTGYERLFELSFQLYEKTRSDKYAEIGYNILEESKSTILSDNLTLQNSYRHPGSDSLISKLKANQAYLAYLKGDPGKNLKSIREYELRVNLILEQLSIVNRPFVESFNPPDHTDLKIFQQKLNSGSVYLNYILIKNSIYIVSVRKNNISVNKTLVNPKQFENHKIALLKSLTQNPGPYSGFVAKKDASYFYNILIKPIESKLAGIKTIIVNPANEIIELSFDILSPDANSDNYLIKKYSIAYLNSANFYNSQSDKFSLVNSEWISFAPFGSKTKNKSDLNLQNLTILPSTIKEINGIKGSAIINDKSTKQAFIKTIGSLKDRVILVATHASENNGDPYLNFFPADDNYKLFANEIQYLDFKTPLVILGACESNAGKKMKGSGVLSIAKSFSIGGCPSVVGSLWEVHDESMAVLVSFFYKHLMRGERKDIALRLAKLEYLQTETGLRNDPPYYWAHLQIIGDVSPLIFWPVLLRYCLYGIVAIIIVIAIVYIIRLRKRTFN